MRAGACPGLGARICRPHPADRFDPRAVRDPLRIRFVHPFYWPDLAGGGQPLTDLAEHLAGEGHDVEVVCSRSHSQGEGQDLPALETRGGVRIRRVGSPLQARRRGLAWRGLESAAFHLSAGFRVAVLGDADVNVTLTTSRFLGLWGRLGQGLRGTRHVVWSMDWPFGAELAQGRSKPRSLVGRWLDVLHAAPLREADRVVALGDGMAEQLTAKGVPPERLELIPTWGEGGDPGRAELSARAMRETRGWGDRFVVAYSGNAEALSCFHGFLEAAEALESRAPKVLLACFGGGPARPELEARVAERGLGNVEFHGAVSREQLEVSLRCADAQLLFLNPNQTGTAARGELYGALASERPVLIASTATGELADTLRAAGAGVAFELGQTAELTAEIERFAQDRERARELGRAGRRAFEQHFERVVCCERWAELFGACELGAGRPLPALAAVPEAEPEEQARAA